MFVGVLLAFTAVGIQAAARPLIEVPGARPDGSVLLPNQWRLRPVGKQVLVGDFPAHIVVHPSSKFCAVLHCGYGAHEIILVSLPSGRLLSRTQVAEAFYGLSFSADGTELFASGAGDEVVRRFKVQEAGVLESDPVEVRGKAEKGVPAGLAVSQDGTSLWVANVMGHQVTKLSLRDGKRLWDLSLSKSQAAQAIVAPPADFDTAAATKRDEARRFTTDSVEPYPYGVLHDAARGRVYVSLWGRAQVAVLDAEQGKWLETWSVEEHPNEMLLSKDGRFLFVANANRNTVTVLDAANGRAVETLSSGLHPDSLPGSTPNSLALTPSGEWLFVANACNNNVAVFDVEKPGASRSLGLIPVGWYPTSVRVTPDGKQLLVANGKGVVSKPNRHGPQPGVTDPPATVREYIGGLLTGTLSIIELPAKDKFPAKMAEYTARALECTPDSGDVRSTNSVVATKRMPPKAPFKLGDRSPIRYCLYIIKENRTYDQVLGDLPQGNGDASLCLFPRQVTPNHHALAEEFVLLDNFYVESEVSADGHEWTVGGYATDYVEKTWPMNYGHGKSGKFPYPSEGRFKIAFPSTGYLWDKAKEAGVTYRNYGEFIDNGAKLGDPARATMPSLEGHFDPFYRCWDMDYPDTKRAERFLAELKRFEREGEMPRLQILRLGNDHTFGTRVGKPTPTSMVAENDNALGLLIQGLSQSKFWSKTAVFVVEDDAQNGPDHVDAHRTIAYAIGPHVKRGVVDSTLYSTASMLRTIELILGLKPMTQFDAAAVPMWASFASKPDERSYRMRPPGVDYTLKTLAGAWGTELSERMDFAKEDAADDLQLNEVIWRSVKGPNSRMPAPLRAAFVRSGGDDDD